jgi:hypothetical protein
MATYVNDLRLKEITTGDESGTWGTSTNTNLELIAEAFSYGTEVITTNADTHTTTIDDGATDPGRSLYLKYTGTLDSACTITIGPDTVSKVWIIENGTSGSQDIILSQGSGANITIPAGDTKVVYSDGAGAGAAFVDAFASLSVVDLKVQDDLTVTGDIDVDGTANLDVVDIDGAVDFASTTAHAGNATFADNAKAIFGAGSDLQLYHDGTNSFITNATGILLQRADDIRLQNGAGSEVMIDATANGAVNLYHNNSAKLATTATGIDVTGTATMDGLVTDSNVDAASFTSASSTYVDINNGTVTGRLQTISSDFFIGTATAATSLAFKSGNGVEAMRIDSSGNVDITYGNLFTDTTSGIFFSGGIGSFTNGVYGVGVNNMAFNVNGSERARIDSSGVLSVPAGYYVGGTAAANLLDDYEEGTWTLTDESGASMSLTVYVAEYTKIGNKVFFEIGMVFPTTSSTAEIRLSLPFTAKATTDNTGGATLVGTDSGRNDLWLVNRNNATFGAGTNLNIGVTNASYSAKQLKLQGAYTAA